MIFQNPIKTRLLLLFVVLYLIIVHSKAFSQSQNLGFPPTSNFAKEDYHAGNQNWDAKWHNGRIYFANNNGLLSFDGTNWQTYATTNNTILRSLAPNGKDTIYVGGQGEIGFFSPNDLGQLSYQPLFEENEFQAGEIWDMLFYKEKLYFISEYNEITEYHKGGTKRYGNTSFISKLALVNDEIWYHDQGEGLHRIKDGHTEFIPNSEFTRGMTISEILYHEGISYIMTVENGIFSYNKGQFEPYQTNADKFLKENKILSAIVSKDGELMLGTNLGGIVTINKERQAVLLVDKGQGLQNNFVTSMALNPDGDLWVGTQNGIDKIHLAARSTIFFPDGTLEGSVYDIEKWNNKLWFCTSTGVYYIDDLPYHNPLTRQKYKLVKGTEGQAWGLNKIGDELFCGHHEGGFQINRDLTATKMTGPAGAWTFAGLDTQTIAVGSYNGVEILRKENGKWNYYSRVAGLSETSRIMTYQNNNLWVSHPYKKVYKINFSQDYKNSTLKEYDKDNGLATNKRNYVYHLFGKTIVTNEQGVFEYNQTTDQFQRADEIEHLFPYGIHLKRIVNKNNQTWAISTFGTEKLSQVTTPDGHKVLTKKLIGQKSHNDSYIGGFENIFPLDSVSFFQCTDSGAKVVSTAVIPSYLDAPVISSAHLAVNHDSLIYAGFGEAEMIELDANENAINFNCSSMDKEKFGHYFMYRLVGFDDNWSEWTKSTTKQYTNLPHGNYSFQAKVVNIHNQESPPAELRFKIKTPWHKSIIAYFLYALLALTGILLLLLLPRKKYKENTAYLESAKEQTEADMKKLEVEKDAEMEQLKRAAELELQQLEKEKLENEINFKNKELAMSTMNLLQKNETLTAIRSEVEKIEKNIKDPQAKKEVKKIISLLRSDDRLDDDWNNFSIHFDQAHHQFLKRIKEAYPKLTPKDQKLCAYLRMNLSTKEIAPLLKISVRGVEISRYRLRKKLELAKEINLNDFMMNF